MAILAVDEKIRTHRDKWVYRGAHRPPFAVEPGPHQESVWDYPRPPRMEVEHRTVVVKHGEIEIARSTHACRVLETAGPPTIYLPPDDIEIILLADNEARSLCEWKGIAVGFDLVDGPTGIGWRYDDTFPEYEAIAGWCAFYPSRLACWVDDHRVRSQPGGYYGGWITQDIVGPFKGEPGTEGL